MNAQLVSHYRALREALGTQSEVATWLDVRRQTIARRETGVTPVRPEHLLALAALANHRKGR
ncbi:Helix-turn-helix protein [Gammaproteobacteria bacterium]